MCCLHQQDHPKGMSSKRWRLSQSKFRKRNHIGGMSQLRQNNIRHYKYSRCWHRYHSKSCKKHHKPGYICRWHQLGHPMDMSNSQWSLGLSKFRRNYHIQYMYRFHQNNIHLCKNNKCRNLDQSRLCKYYRKEDRKSRQNNRDQHKQSSYYRLNQSSYYKHHYNRRMSESYIGCQVIHKYKHREQQQAHPYYTSKDLGLK